MAEDDEFDLPMPLGGVSDELAFSKQNLATTREAFNARPQDPTNGRERISQRAGLSKANAEKLDAANRVIEIVSTVFDSRNLTYSSTPGAETQEWAVESPSKESIFHGVTDRAGSVYIADGPSAVAKLNPDGAVIWQLPLPVKDKNHAIRFVFVDEVFDVYVGVSSGSRSDLGQLWKLTQLPEDEVEIAWEVALDAWVESAKVYRDKLYTIQNDPKTGAAYVRIYSALNALLPRLTQEWRVPFPANDFDVSADGNTFVASARQPNSTAANTNHFNPRWPRTAASGLPLFPEVVDWTPRDLDDFERRVWSWYKADDITEFDVAGPLEEGARILRWPDRSGKGRHLYEPSSIGLKPPTLAFGALGTRKGVKFNGLDQALVSLSNASIKKQYADQQKTAWPAYEGSMFCSVIVCRPEKRTSGNPCFIMGQGNDAAGATDHIVIANRDDGSALPGSFASAQINHYAATDGTGDGGRGTNGHPLMASFDNDHDAAIIVILWDGGIDPNNSGATFTRSLFQLNGSPIDRYEGLGNFTKDPTIIGWWDNPGSGIDFLSGDIVEIFTLDRADRDDDTSEPKVLSHDKLENTSANVDQTVNELTELVGYLAQYYGLSHLLPRDSASYTHPYGRQSETFFTTAFVDTLVGPPIDGHLGAFGRTTRNHPCLTKWGPTGELLWALNGEEADPLASSNGLVGVGYGVRVDFAGNVFSMGPSTTAFDSSPSTLCLRKIIDQGDDFSLVALDGAWGVAIPSPSYAYPRMAVDEFGNVYVPVATGTNGLRVYKGTDGTQLAAVAIGVPEREVYAVAIDPRIPDYGDDLTTKLARFAYAFGQAGADPPVPIYKIRLVQESPLEGSPRAHVHLGISAGGIARTFALGGASMNTPTGGAGALSATPVYVQAVGAFQKAFITDSVSKIQVFDPREDTIGPLESTTPGSPPHGAKLLELFKGRLFGARAPGLIGGAFDWAASRAGDPFDWNNFPPERDPAAAIAGENEFGPGMCPDIINALVPLGDDFLLFGCDHSIWMLSGDPGDGGQFDLVSDVTGIAFGRPYCRDPEGNTWFIGSRGGLFVISPGGRPVRLSERSIDVRLAQINFETHYVRLAWNDDDRGVHILRFPLGSVLPDPTEHWFWDRPRRGAWPDTFGSANEPDVEPSAVYVVDGDDPDDRRVLFGCRDGYIRQWDPDVNDDDGIATDFSVLVGPLVSDSSKREMRFVGPRVVLASDQGGATYELFATDDAALIGAPRRIGELVPGRNPLKRGKMRGSFCFVRIRNSVAGQRCAIEEAAMRAYPAGLKRVRETP